MRIALLWMALASSASMAHAASPNHDVEWNGVSHIAWLDRRPLCPVGGEAFVVRFQSFRDDLTSARVQVTAGGAPTWIDAARTEVRGPYDVWTAAIPATASTTLSYVVELTDGSDTDYLSVGGVTDGFPADGGFALNFTTLEHAPIGATPVSGGGAVFKVWAPTRTSTYVRGTFNGWGLANPLTKVGEYFIGRVPSVADRSEYKFFFNNATWNTDPRARALNPIGGNNNAYVENPFRYVWTGTDFTVPQPDSMIIYQLHVGTFAGLNDPVGSTPFPSRYRDVAARVQHLKDLGVNAVQFNPFTEFPTDISAGYNPIAQFAPEWAYGTPDDLKAMVDVLHQNGIAVLLDIVWNHFSPSDNFLWNYDGSQQWFDTPAVNTPWGSQADFDRAAVRDYFLSSALYWLEEFRLDGFRMDATAYMDIAPQAAAGYSLMQQFNDALDRRAVDKFAIAEQLPNDAVVSRATSAGGAGFDAQYHMAFRDAVRGAVFDAAFGDPNMNAVRGALAGSGPDISGRRAFNYVELHDEAWASSGGQRLVRSIDGTAPHDDAFAKGRTKLAFGLTLVSAGVPALLQGTEWLESVDWAPDAAGRIDWSKKSTYAGIFAYYSRLCGLRRTRPALRASASLFTYHVNEPGNVLAMRRWAGAEQAVVVASFANADQAGYRIGVPASGYWSETVNSEDPQYLGDGPVNATPIASEPIAADGYAQSIVLNVPRMGLLLLEPTANVDAGAPVTPRGITLGAARPSPAIGAIRVTLTLPVRTDVRARVVDAAGRSVAWLADGVREAGAHELLWDGRDAGGRLAPAGLYFLVVDAGGVTRSTRIARVR